MSEKESRFQTIEQKLINLFDVFEEVAKLRKDEAISIIMKTVRDLELRSEFFVIEDEFEKYLRRRT